MLSDSFDPASGFQGTWSFDNAQQVNFSQIETLTQTADLSVSVSVSPNPVDTGTLATYTVTVSNSGSIAAANVTLTDPVPTGMVFVSAMAADSSLLNLAGPDFAGTGSVFGFISSLSAGASTSMTVVVRVLNTVAAGMVITNTVTATTSSGAQSPSLLCAPNSVGHARQFSRLR